jgi:hypothetical protein
LWLSWLHLICIRSSLLRLGQVTVDGLRLLLGGPRWAFVGVVSHGDPLREVIVGLVGVPVVKTLIEVAGLAAWKGRYKVGLRVRGFRYS